MARPRNFDRDLALKAAMEVFWTKGYEGAQVADLTAAMGINPPSFYAAFDSKEAAFREAVDLYVATAGSTSMRALADAPTVRAGLRAMIEASIDIALSSSSGGCLLILGVVNCLAENETARTYLKQARAKTETLIKARIVQAVTEGELPASTDARALASHFHGVLQAISFQARDGASRKALRRLVEPAMAALPAAQ